MANETERIQGSMFEALFERRLKPTGRFLEDLARAGYDMSNPKPEYDASVFSRCIDIAREHAFADVPRREGIFRIGMALSESYFADTISGRIIAVALPLVGPGRMIKTLPRRMRTGTSKGEVQVDELGERRWRVTMMEVNQFPELVAGALQASLTRTGVSAKAQVNYDIKDRTEILVEWESTG